MRLRDRAALIAMAIFPQVFSRYEAGQHWSARRSCLPGFVRDARFDASTATRKEIIRKARYFEANNAVANRLLDLWEQYTCGPKGLQFVPASSDEDWNSKAKEFWEEWQPLCDVSSRHHFGTVQTLAARCWAVDGDSFLLKTRGRERPNGPSFPRIQLIEAHRVDTPPDYASDERVIDGVRIDERGRPMGYYVRDGEDDRFTYREADAVVHVWEPARPGMVRSLSHFYPCLNDLHDLDDLQMLTMDGAKEAAASPLIIKTKTGELPWDDLRRARFLGSGTQGTSGGTAQERSQYYHDIFGARAKVLRHNDECQYPELKLPSIATREYWDYLTSKVCAGFGISKLLVFPWSMQGTVTRADLDVANAFFRSRSSVLASAFTSIYHYVIGWGVANRLELSDPPADWRKVSVRPPRSVNVDVGRNSSALIEDYKAGWRTLEAICGELGEDWNDVLRQRAIERAKARSLEKEFQLHEGELIGAVLDYVKQGEAQEEAESQPEAEEVAA